MSIDDPELLSEFVIESHEHLSDVENQLLSLESQGDDMDIALVNTVFRAVHSVKGAAGFLGLDVLQALAHRGEEVLNKLRNNQLRPTSVVINTLLDATDRLKSLLDGIDTSNSEDISDHVNALELILSDEGSTSAPAAPQDEQSPAVEANTASSDAESEAELATDDGLSAEGLREFLVESHDNLERLESDLISLETEPASEALINGVFRNIHTIKGTAGFLGFTKLERLTHVAETLLGDVRSGVLPLGAEIASGLLQSVDKVRELLQSIEDNGTEADCGSDSLADALTKLHEILLPADLAAELVKKSQPASPSKPAPAKPSSPAAPVAATPVAVAPAPTPAAPAPAPAEPPAKPAAKKPAATPGSKNEVSAADSTIRVDVALLDKLMTGVGELVLARNQIIQFSNDNVESELYRTSQRLNLITSELQESVMKTRMQPIGNVWSKFPRLVRDLAGICEKEVRIEMEGKTTELDKTIIESIKDPLTHLVRNTVDHGIERPEDREAAGKPREGCLTLKAYHEGGQVNIEICDDGAGINADRIKAKALEKGLMSQDQLAKMSDLDAGNLIFLPGFSTAEKVSNVSGRGVGMDVVKTNIEKIGGTVDLQSEQGIGTTIKIKIPLTLAIIPALVVSSDGNRFAIPQVNLLELVRLEGVQAKESIEWILGAPVYRLRGRLLPLVYLRDILDTRAEDGNEDDVINIVVLRADDRQFGLVVDHINDTEEIVVKPLSQQLKAMSVYAGATIMGDGKVALILDVLGIAHEGEVISKTRDRAQHESAKLKKEPTNNNQTCLVLGTDSKRRLTLPISQVARLEQIPIEKIEMAERNEVVQYRGEIVPLIRLAEVLGYSSGAEKDGDLLNVVVYTENERSYGIVVDHIIDIVDTEVDITRKSSGHGVIGSAVIQGCVTDLVDLPAIIRQVEG